MGKPCKSGAIKDTDQLPQGYVCPCMMSEKLADYPDLMKTFPTGPFAGGENTADKLRRIKGGHHG